MKVKILAACIALGMTGVQAGHVDKTRLFQPIATFDVMAGNGSSVAEIIDATHSRQLVYTDSENGEIGIVDIRNPRNPQPLGVVEVGGEPTSLAIRGRYALVAVNTSSDYASPSGKLVVVRLTSRQIVAQIELGGQPDSIAISPNRQYAAVVLENERDEDLNGGLIPQNKTGELLIINLRGNPNRWKIRNVDLSALADPVTGAFAGSDLEPEYVDINRRNQAVVSFQENNHLAIVDLRSAQLVNHFSAGEVELVDVDTNEEDLITLDSTIVKRREPDAVSWIDDDSFATANEGDYEDGDGVEGGSRGFTIFNIDGSVEYESHASFEHALVRIGHYNEGRSENKGVEPEAVDAASFNRMKLLFVGSERSNAVGVYDVSKPGQAELKQLLPTGIGPEGLKAIPSQRLFVASTEKDEAGDGIPTMINIYKYTKGDSRYPQIESANDTNGLPIPWVALSGLAANPVDPDTLYAVSDSFLAKGFIYTIDVSRTPAVITARLEVNADDLDLEGLAVGPDGAFWLGSEGEEAGGRENLVLKIDPLTGNELARIHLPAGMVDERRKNGIEGIAVTGSAGAEVVYVAIQRAWPKEGDIDSVNTKIGRYEVASGSWGFVHYPLDAPGNGGWIGLSELTILPDGKFAVIERDKGWGSSTPPNAELKALFKIDLANAEFRTFDNPAGLVTLEKRLLADLQPEIAANSIWTAEKLEGMAVAADGETYVVTDNDGVDGAPGETLFLRLGPYGNLGEE
jgi:hypothetical protein